MIHVLSSNPAHHWLDWLAGELQGATYLSPLLTSQCFVTVVHQAWLLNMGSGINLGPSGLYSRHFAATLSQQSKYVTSLICLLQQNLAGES